MATRHSESLLEGLQISELSSKKVDNIMTKCHSDTYSKHENNDFN